MSNKGLIITIDEFEGPLDLMVHLIKENKLDLFDLDILVLTNQYIAFLHLMETLDLEIASEYLVMLADLIEYKSKRLLPKEGGDLTDRYEDVDPDKLVARIIEYKRYKEVSEQLALLSLEREKLMGKPQSSLIDQWIVEADVKIEPMAIYQLFNAMERVQKRLSLFEPIKLKRTERELTVEDRITQIFTMIKELPSIFSFEDLCSDVNSKMMIIMTFLAVLELLKKQQLIYHLENEILYFQKGVNYE